MRLNRSRSFPSRRAEFADTVGGPGAQSGEDVDEVFADVDLEATAGFEHREDGNDLGSGAFIPQVKPVFAVMRSSA